MMTVASEWAIAVLLRATVLLGAALVVSWLFARRWPAPVSAWHRAALAGLLALPLGVAAAPPLRLALLPPLARTTASQDGQRRATRNEGDLWTRWQAGEASREASPTVTSPYGICDKGRARANIDQPPLGVTPALQDRRHPGWSLEHVILAVYLAGVVVGLLRLLQGWHQAARLRGDTMLADPAWQGASIRWCRALGIRSEVPVRISDRLAVPATMGWLHPVILIPHRIEKTNPGGAGQGGAALVHELAHVARRDAFWQWIARLAGIVYWFHPLMWLLRRELETTRDAACDSICAFHLGVANYVRALADLAQGLTSRGFPLIGLCMARSSRLAGRIRRLKRVPQAAGSATPTIQRFLPWAAGLCVALSTAVITPVARPAAAETPPATSLRQPPKPGTESEGKSQASADRSLTSSMATGIVLDEDGRSLPNATVLVRVVEYRRIRDPHSQTTYVPLERRQWRLTTGREGSYQVQPGDRPDGIELTVIVTVTAPGRLEREQRSNWQALAQGKLPEIRLTRGRIVDGRIVARSGQGVADASIRAISRYRRRFDWEPGVGALDVDRKTRWLYYFPRVVRPSADGRFEVALPTDAYAELIVSAPDWAPQRVAVQADALGVGDVKLLPGWSLSGAMLDRQGRPVAGRVVMLASIDRGNVQGFSAALERCVKTDSQGRFTLPPARGIFSVGLSPVCALTSDDGPPMISDGPLVALAPTVVRLDGSDPKPSLMLREPETVTLSGRVTWKDGSPANDVEFVAWGVMPSVPGLKPSHGLPYYALAAAWSDKEGQYRLIVPRGLSVAIDCSGAWSQDRQYYRAWPKDNRRASQLDVGSMHLKEVGEDVAELDWVLKPEQDGPRQSAAAAPRSPAGVQKPPAASPAEEALGQLEREIKAARDRGEDSRLTMLGRCFEVEQRHRGTAAAIGALHFIMRAAATCGSERSVFDARDRAVRLLREHYLAHRDVDLLIDEFTAGMGGSADCEELLRAARTQSPHPYVRAAAGLFLAEWMWHQAKIHKMVRDTDLGKYGPMIEAQTSEDTRQWLRAQRDQIAEAQKRLGHFDENSNERALIAILDEAIKDYAGVKAPRYRWERPDYTLRLTRPIPDGELGVLRRVVDYPARAAIRKFQVTQLKMGQAMPDLAGKDLEGRDVRLSDDRGRVVVLTVGNWYDKDDSALQQCRELRQRHGADRLALVSVVEADPQEPYRARNRATDAGITWKVIADPDGEACARWCQQTFPEVYVIDAAGILRFHGTGGRYGDAFSRLVDGLVRGGF